MCRQSLIAESDGPFQQSEVVLGRSTNSFRRLLSAVVINRDCGMAAFVRIDTDDHHGTVSLRRVVARTGRSAYPNRGDATLS
jgi:hypothetical protein